MEKKWGPWIGVRIFFFCVITLLVVVTLITSTIIRNKDIREGKVCEDMTTQDFGYDCCTDCHSLGLTYSKLTRERISRLSEITYHCHCIDNNETKQIW